jgi:methyl-accepting chemotaxis protein
MMLSGRLKIDTSEAGAHTACLLGKWYYKAGKEQYGHLPEFVAIERPHISFHAAVKDAVESYNRGDRQRAETQTQEAGRISKEVVAAINQLEVRLSGHVVVHSLGDAASLAPERRARAQSPKPGNGARQKVAG